MLNIDAVQISPLRLEKVFLEARRKLEENVSDDLVERLCYCYSIAKKGWEQDESAILKAVSAKILYRIWLIADPMKDEDDGVFDVSTPLSSAVTFPDEVGAYLSYVSEDEDPEIQYGLGRYHLSQYLNAPWQHPRGLFTAIPYLQKAYAQEYLAAQYHYGLAAYLNELGNESACKILESLFRAGQYFSRVICIHKALDPILGSYAELVLKNGVNAEQKQRAAMYLGRKFVQEEGSLNDEILEAEGIPVQLKNLIDWEDLKQKAKFHTFLREISDVPKFSWSPLFLGGTLLGGIGTVTLFSTETIFDIIAGWAFGNAAYAFAGALILACILVGAALGHVAQKMMEEEPIYLGNL